MVRVADRTAHGCIVTGISTMELYPEAVVQVEDRAAEAVPVDRAAVRVVVQALVDH